MKDENLRAVFPTHYGVYYGGAWHDAVEDTGFDTINPANGEILARVADAGRGDVDRAVEAAHEGYLIWRDVVPLERARIMRATADVFRRHADELALLESINGGNPVSETKLDVMAAAAYWDFFAGLVTELKGSSVPMGPKSINFSVREPRGVVLRIAPFNHPFLFSAGRLAAPLAAGNSVVVKPPEQAPLSALRMAELVDGLLPPGVINVVPGQRETGAALVAHRRVAMVTLTGSAATGKAVMREAASSLKPVLLELGGKNALIAYEDVDPAIAASAIVRGMNFTWSGQSCGSTSRAFVHRDIYDEVLRLIPQYLRAHVPGIPSDPRTTMGAICSKAQHAKVLSFIRAGVDDGARLLSGGNAPTNPELADGFFIEPTVFVDVKQSMRIANEEIFGPVVSILPWSNEEEMLRDVNAVDYGLTCSIWTDRLERAHRTANKVEVGFVWINEVGKHFLGAPFGGYKQSGIGREECFEELVSYSREKHVHVNIATGVSRR
ncbi:betaine-aldehyde dehydrogenase [Burkholderia sp. D7]|nr:betaine-aldehyde dehydrogenase [Burkholderia sp. D7]